MNRLAQSLAHLCKDHPFEEKWLLAPSLRTGHQWLDTVARGGQPSLNVHVKTLTSMALDLAAGEMAARGVALLSGRAGGLFIDRILREKLKSRLKYLNQVEPSARLAEVVLAGIHAIRLADLSTTGLESAKFEVSLKGDDMVLIIKEYRKLLEDEKMIDYPDVLGLAEERLTSDPVGLGGDILVFIPEDLELKALERRFLDRIPEERRRILAVEKLPDPSSPPGPVASDIDILPWILDHTNAPEAPSDGSVSVTHAVGEVNEVRGLLRHCLINGIPWDQVELLHTDASTYVPIVYETLLAIDHGGNGSGIDDELPVTFREGIPCRYSRPGQALAAWLQWIDEEFPQALLVRMVREGLLLPPAREGEHSGFTRLAVLLRGVSIGFGRGRYLPKITERIEGIKHRLRDTYRLRNEDGKVDPVRLDYIERDLRDLNVLRGLVSNLLNDAPDNGMSQSEIVARTRKFLETSARCVSKLDTFARQKLVEELDDMEYWLSREDRETGIDIWEWLESLSAGTAVLGSGPRPGCLHVDNILSGGHSGRWNTFIVGMDDSRFPGVGLQDPLLLDSERSRLSQEIPTAAKRLERKIISFARLLARLRGNVTFSFSSLNLLEDRDMFPSPVLLSVYRLLTGDAEGDQQSFFEWLPTPVSFAPEDPESCLDPVEWWMWRMTGPETVRDPEDLVHGLYPHLARGREAAEAREGSRFTAYDGYVPQAGVDLDPTAEGGPVMSSNRLQTIGQCPRRFFFQYGLGILPPEDLVIDPRQWLDPLTRGTLLHELFEEFMRGMIEGDRLPNFERDCEDLERLLQRKVEEYTETYPPPNDAILFMEQELIRMAALTFLREEERYFTRNERVPLFLETSLGLLSEGHGSPLDTGDPLSLELPDGRQILVRGRIDRIDKKAGNLGEDYYIWDYKTGKGSWGYEKADPFQQGRKVQPYLYVQMAGERLREAVSSEAKVKTFGFFFPGERAVGERIDWRPGELIHGGEVVEQLCQTVINGAFSATDDWIQDCRYCDYRSICADLESVASFSELKLKNRENTMLKPFQELRGKGQ